MEGYPSRSPERYNLHNPLGERKPPVYTGRFGGFVVRLIHLADMAPGSLIACGSFAEPSGSTPQGAVSVIRSNRAPPVQPCNPQRIGRLPTPDTLLRFGVPRSGRVSPAVGPLSFAPNPADPTRRPPQPQPADQPRRPTNHPRRPTNHPPTPPSQHPARTHPPGPTPPNQHPPNARRTPPNENEQTRGAAHPPHPTKTNRPRHPTTRPGNVNRPGNVDEPPM